MYSRLPVRLSNRQAAAGFVDGTDLEKGLWGKEIPFF
jgi:hypothetical protein